METEHKKKKWAAGILAVFGAAFLYLMGAAAPFLHYEEISEETKETFQTAEFYSEETGPDRAMIMETNKSAWEERMRLFSQAEDRIIMSTFDMRDGESTRDVLAVLYEKAEQGVDIKILVDGISGVIRMEGNELFYALSGHPNVEIKLYNRLNPFAPWKTQGRMHDKYIIADDLAYILGGRNQFDYFIGEYPTKNRSYDREILIYNTGAGSGSRESSLFQVEAYFEDMWSREECTYFHEDAGLLEKEKVKAEILALEERYERLTAENPELFEKSQDYAARTKATNKVTLINNPTHIYGKEPVVFYKLMELAKEADSRVIFQTPYIVCNSYMLKELTELSEAVPDSRILINSVENGDNFMASSDYLYRKGEIVETGIPIYEYDGGLSNHGKSMVIDDDLAVIGSYNMDLRSTYVDTELMLAVHSEAIAGELSGYMAAMEADSRRVIGKTEYETPKHLTVEPVPWWKMAAMRVVGLLMQGVRGLV